MALPAEISVSFDFSSGATFGYPFTIGDAKNGVLGTGTLAALQSHCQSSTLLPAYAALLLTTGATSSPTPIKPVQQS